MARQPRVDPAWEKLAQLLIQRRTKLDPRYHNRRTFCQERKIDYRVISDLEGARRENFSGPMLSAIEVAYGLPAGLIEKFVRNPDTTEFPLDHHAASGTISLGASLTGSATTTDGDRPSGLSLQDMDPWEQKIWEIRELSVHEREMAIAMVRWIQDPTDDDFAVDLWLKLGPHVAPILRARLEDEPSNGTPRAG